MTRMVGQQRQHQPILAVVRTVERKGVHPLPVTVRYVPAEGEAISWWELCGVGWHALRGVARDAGLNAGLIKPDGCVAAWQVSEIGLTGPRSRELDEDDALEMIAEIGLPSASEIAHVRVPTGRTLPPGREGAARRLARRMPAEVTPEVSSALYRMFSSMEDCAARRYHMHFWSWALRNRGVMTQPVVAVGTQVAGMIGRSEGSAIPPQEPLHPRI